MWISRSRPKFKPKGAQEKILRLRGEGIWQLCAFGGSNDRTTCILEAGPTSSLLPGRYKACGVMMQQRPWVEWSCLVATCHELLETCSGVSILVSWWDDA